MGLPYCNSSLPLSVRVADLVSRLSVEEKQGMLDTSSGGSKYVAPYNYWSESLHGVANNVGTYFAGAIPYTTSFPMAITSAMSFNETAWHAIGVAIGDEARAMSNIGHTGGNTFWAPTINAGRDSRQVFLQSFAGLKL